MNYHDLSQISHMCFSMIYLSIVFRVASFCEGSRSWLRNIWWLTPEIASGLVHLGLVQL